jgi:hypothetical protein
MFSLKYLQILKMHRLASLLLALALVLASSYKSNRRCQE